MSFNVGAGALLGIGKESTWGTPVADTMLLNYTSESLKPEVSKTEEENLLTSKAASAYNLMGIKVAGDISGILKPENAGLLLKLALGGADTVVQNFGSVTGQHQHTIIAQSADSALPSFTAFVNRKAAVKKYSGCKIDSLKLTAKAGDYVRFTATVKGKDEASGTITSTALPTKKAYKFIGATVTIGGTAFEFMSVEFNHQNQLEEGPQTNLSGVYNSESAHAKRKSSFTLEAPYDAAAEALIAGNLYTDTVIAAVVLHLESPEVIASTSKYRMDITLNNVQLLSGDRNVDGAGIIKVPNLSGEATDTGAAEPISVAIYDNKNSAY